MYAVTDLTRRPPSVSVHPVDPMTGQGVWWSLEIWTSAEACAETITLLADSPSDLEALGQAIVDAARTATQRSQEPHTGVVSPDLVSEGTERGEEA